MDIWVRLLNLPLGWMDDHRGSRAMKLLGKCRAYTLGTNARKEEE
jgi:hypothetical protein